MNVMARLDRAIHDPEPIARRMDRTVKLCDDGEGVAAAAKERKPAMRAPRDEDGRAVPYNAELCRATRRMRDRMAAMQARIDALEAELAAERADIAAERAEFVERLESPEAQRDVMLIAQELLQAETIDALSGPARRGVCEHCGGLGEGMTRGLLADRINDHCARHGLPRAAQPIDDVSWPRVTSGYGRDFAWHKPPERDGERLGARVW